MTTRAPTFVRFCRSLALLSGPSAMTAVIVPTIVAGAACSSSGDTSLGVSCPPDTAGLDPCTSICRSYSECPVETGTPGDTEAEPDAVADGAGDVGGDDGGRDAETD